MTRRLLKRQPLIAVKRDNIQHDFLKNMARRLLINVCDNWESFLCHFHAHCMPTKELQSFEDAYYA